MARLPVGAEVLVTPSTWVPLVNLNSVYVLPGIPSLFKSMVSAHQARRLALESTSARSVHFT
jgi:molybdopterin-biosynthesis enzyme MoeA-like protein